MIRLALPTGDLRKDTAALLDTAGIGIEEYAAGSRALRFPMLGGDGVARVFREKDIPVQVALGNYDAGICSISWVEELAQRFPGHRVVRVRDLGYGLHSLWLAAAGDETQIPVRLVSEYPNIAESVARRLRLPRYRVFPVWGAAEAYPPEDADVAIIAAPDAAAVEAHGLRPLAPLLDASAWLIVNGDSLASRNLARLLARLLALKPAPPRSSALSVPASLGLRPAPPAPPRAHLRLALPDGHAQSHTVAALRAAGISIAGYDEGRPLRRPVLDATGVDVKVVRPQDMPQQVALGQFDLAVTGRDWLFDHLVQFPSSPVEEVADLRRSRYGLAAIVKGVRAETVAGAVAEWRARSDAPIRVASEYPNIADHFARERHLGRYSVIPIAGASEGFVPDDAEILIEGIDTGSSVRANKLTVLERFFESTNCVIANKQRPAGALRPLFDALLERLAAGAAEPVAAGGA
ncbi:MAG TPA: ATP phosphoribosyltransferase [Dehalococcoidia bacterium]|nr:ATP phosphoribosyltransferase [Dehalococcoidia bacterium]